MGLHGLVLIQLSAVITSRCFTFSSIIKSTFVQMYYHVTDYWIGNWIYSPLKDRDYK
jgi:hypothetical protein